MFVTQLSVKFGPSPAAACAPFSAHRQIHLPYFPTLRQAAPADAAYRVSQSISAVSPACFHTADVNTSKARGKGLCSLFVGLNYYPRIFLNQQREFFICLTFKSGSGGICRNTIWSRFSNWRPHITFLKFCSIILYLINHCVSIFEAYSIKLLIYFILHLFKVKSNVKNPCFYKTIFGIFFKRRYLKKPNVPAIIESQIINAMGHTSYFYWYAPFYFLFNPAGQNK